MNAMLSVMTSELAIILYLCIAIAIVLFFVVKFQKKNTEYKRNQELNKSKSKEDDLNQAIINEKRGDNQ